MEGTPLRSVPARPQGPVAVDDALAHVRAELPRLAEPAQRALALVDLAGLSREQAAANLHLAAADLARLLATARKALRRQLIELPSGGWCERAERLISDRLDDALSPSGAARLEAHLGACERCTTHEHKLIQAHDRLIQSFVEAHAAPEPVALLEAPQPVAELRLVEPPAVVEKAVAAPVQAAIQRRLLAFVWYLAFALAVVLAVATVVITTLAAVGSLKHVP